MNDTAPRIEARLTALYRQRSPGARVRMATAMYQTAKRLALAGLRHERSDRSDSALAAALLDRLYGDELAPALRAALAARMGQGQ